LTITPTASQTKIYGTNDPSSGFTYSETGLYTGDSITGNLGRASGETIGNYSYNMGSLAASTNYSIALNPATFGITPAALTITANPQTKVYGTSDPSLTYTQTGLVVNTTVDGVLINDALTGALTRVAGQNVGTYPILQGTLSAGTNYSTTYNGSTFSITPLPDPSSNTSNSTSQQSFNPSILSSISVSNSEIEFSQSLTQFILFYNKEDLKTIPDRKKVTCNDRGGGIIICTIKTSFLLDNPDTTH
jgi:hypothetical protein